MRIMVAVRNNDHVSGQAPALQITAQLGEVHDLVCGPVNILQNVSVPDCAVVTPVVGGPVAVVSSCDCSPGCLVGLRINLPGNTSRVHLPKDVVICDGIGSCGPRNE